MKKPRPKPISIRPKSQAIRDKYIAMGGAKWFNLYFEVEVMKDQKQDLDKKESGNAM